MTTKKYLNNLPTFKNVLPRVRNGQVKFPYLAAFNTKDREFILLGTRHSNEISNPHIELIKKLVNDFAERYPNGIIISENNCHDTDRDSIDEAIHRVGESGATHWYAHLHNMAVVCMEPPYPEVITKLCQRFKPKDVVHTMIEIAVEPCKRIGSLITAEQGLERQLDYWSKHEKLIKTAGFTPTKEWFKKYKVGAKSSTIIGEMVQIRDETILSEITKLWKSGKSILMIYGGTHILRLAPAIEQLVGTEPQVIE
ncbi:MAG: hypothetical protein A2998_02500 [Candidatus Staskawiczbacteria bacterium RIFCSPLOWO2_01_FULL_37_25b]|uniref:Haem-binding uptake Tiki superfamily ChaN domain-containing protein n=1 Tax=Candidatus Staskawiczbacteria bacterium RIFCSPLOWO2_01_FULL_37_25b TaxID=1802213 RepID=A0A1G2IDX5_9BACT|nr:MAG: hypothetical protein A2998_02500 [Candidatus Staskawiczbacteria bacterium RIFCSPLOWO2_01_FULL_37_25b]